MKTKLLSQVRSLALLTLCVGGVTLLSSFDGTGSSNGTGGGWSGLGPETDCSTLVPQYNNTSTSGSGGGSLSGGYGSTGANGSVSGSGSGTTTNNGLVGYVRTPQVYQNCDSGWSFSCTSVACHQKGSQTFIPI